MVRKLICVLVVVLVITAVSASPVEAGRFRSVTRARYGPFATRVYSRTVVHPTVRPIGPVLAAPYPVTTVAPVTVRYTYSPYYYPVTPVQVAPAPVVTFGVYPAFGFYGW